MSFDLTGYEKDNIGIKSFFIYTIIGVTLFFIIIFFLLLYYDMERERLYDEIVLQGGTEETMEYKIQQNRILNSFGNKNDNGIESSRIPIADAIQKTIKYYND